MHHQRRSTIRKRRLVHGRLASRSVSEFSGSLTIGDDVKSLLGLPDTFLDAGFVRAASTLVPAAESFPL